MRCPACQQTSRADAQFCLECGAPLERSCSQCGRSLPAEAAFCDGCGARMADSAQEDLPSARSPASYTPKHLAERILHSRSALEGERKQVTVLFADVKGSMALAEQVDAEEWHLILDRFFAILSEGVHRFEGTVNQYTGDGIMALFGAPLAHEDHAQRACHAALHLSEVLRSYAQELRRDQGLDFSVRMGLNSGDVVVGKIGDDMRMDYTAQGQTVGLAARLEQLAETGRAYVSESTAELASGYFDLEDLGDFRLKGVSGSTRVFALSGLGAIRTRLAMAQSRGFSKFVGRENELAILEEALGRAHAGEAQVVGISGEAGSGKSRLCQEFIESCRERGLDVIQAHGLTHGKQIPMLPMLQLLRDFFTIEEGEPDQSAREKIAGRLLLLDDELKESLPLAFDLMQVPDPDRPLPRMDVATRQHQVVSLLRRTWKAGAEKLGGVTVLEDLHWFDPASEVLLERMVESLEGSPQLLILNFRPDFQATWLERPFCQMLNLHPLGPEESRELAQHLLGADPSVTDLSALISEQTGGNPFFIEEVIQAMAQHGQLEGNKGSYRLLTSVEHLEVPSTVRSIVSARIDRLGDREKHVLQAASVIGKRFEAQLVEPLTELAPAQLAEALRALSDAEFIYEESGSASMEYAFRHPLTQEVAYDSQLRDRRARLHGALARELMELGPEKLDENAPLLSHHWEQAGERLEAARWRRRAAIRVAESSPDSAREHWRKIIALLDEQAEDEEAAELMIQACTNVLLLSFIAGVSTDELTGVYYRGRALAEATEDTRSLALLTGVYGLAAGASTGELPIYVRHAREALELAEQAGETAVLMISSLLLGSALTLIKQLPESREVCRRGLEVGRTDPTRRELGEDLFELHLVVQDAEVQGYMGEPRSAIERIEQILPRARELEATTLEMLALQGHAVLLQVLGETEAVERDAARARAIAETNDAPSLQIFAQRISGMANEMRGEWGAAESCFATALSLSEEHRTAVWSQPLYLAHRARDLAELGDFERARATAAGALQRSQQLGSERECVLLTLASILIQGGNPEDRREVEACLDEVEASITAWSYASIRPDLHLERGRLARASGDGDRAQRELEHARRLLVAMGARARAAALTA